MVLAAQRALETVRAAAHRIGPWIHTTPLLESAALNDAAGTRVPLKAESLQKAGSIKFRGAMNKMLLLTEQERCRGVVAYSSGNHALVVSQAAAALGIAAVVVMPEDAPAIKIGGSRRHGAELVLYDRQHDDREALCARWVAARGLLLIRPFDDQDVMAGAGTGALEAVGQLPADVRIDAVAVCCGGGGSTSGWATVVRGLLPEARIWAVEPEDFDDVGRSSRQGSRLANARRSGALCGALLSPMPGALTFPLMQACTVEGAVVSDTQVREAMRFAFEHLKLVLEPGGAAALAAVLARRFDAGTRGVLAILSGGNVDTGSFVECIRP